MIIPSTDPLSQSFLELEQTHTDTLETRKLLRTKLADSLKNIELDTKKHSDKDVTAMLGILNTLNTVLNDIDRQAVDRTRLRLADKRNDSDEAQAAVVSEYLKTVMKNKRDRLKDNPPDINEADNKLKELFVSSGEKILDGEIDKE